MDDSFFKDLVKNLAFIIKADHIFICRVSSGEASKCVETIAFWSDGKIIDNVRFNLEDTPCEKVVEGNICFYPKGLQKLFPEAEKLVTLNAESYLGCPVYSNSGLVLGFVSVFNPVQLENEQELTKTVQAFASLAGSEFERNQTLEKLELSEARLQEVADCSKSIIWETDAELRYTYISPIVTELFGYTPDEIIGRHHLDFVYEEDVAKFIEEVGQNLKTERIIDGFEYRVVDKQSEIHHIVAYGIALYDDQGDLVSCRGSSIDVTESKLAERSLHDQETFNRSVLEYSLDAFIAISDKGKVIRWNAQAEKIFGWSETEVLGKSLDQFIVPKGKKAAHRNGIKRVLETGESHILNQRMKIDAQHKEGHTFQVELTITPIYSDNKITSFSAFIRDITERKRQEDLREAELSILEMIAQNKPQKEIFEQLCLAMEKQASTEAFGSVLLVNKVGTHLELGAAPSFNKQVQEALDGLSVGECSGSCAAAVYRKAPLFVSDVQVDPVWAEFREFAKEHHIEACWSMPFYSENGVVIGSFALTHSIVVEPTESDIRVMKLAAHLAGISVERSRSQDALIKSEEKFSKAFENSPDWIAITRLSDGKILDINKATCQLSGYSREELVGRKTTEPMVYKKPEQRALLIKKLMEEGEFHNVETELVTKEGKNICALVSSVLMEIDGEQCTFTVGRDITEKKESEEALKASDERFTKALEVSPDAVVITRVADGKIIEGNDACIRLTGYDREELIGKTTLELNIYPLEERNRVVSLLQEKGKYDNFESILTRKDGVVLNTLSSGVILELQGELCIFAIVHDITQQKRDQVALLESEEKFRSAFGKAPIGVSLVNSDGVIFQTNEMAHISSGYTEEEFCGKSIKDMTHPDDLERSMRMFRLLVSGEINHYEIEKRYLNKAGGIVWSQLNMAAVKDAEQNFSYAIAHNMDITERKKSEIDLYERTEEEGVFANLLKFSFLPMDEYMQLSLEEILSVSWIKVEDQGGIFLTKEQGDSKTLQLITTKRMADELLTLCDNVDFGTCLCGQAALSKQIQFADCVDDRHETRFEGMSPHGHYNVPVINDGKVLGVIVLYLAEGHESQTKEIDFLNRIADVLSLGIARKYAEEKVNYQAAHDSLTGLVSRRAFESRLQHVLASSDSSDDHALCYMDLDQFKVINDDGGHLAGDELLHQLANLLQSKVRKQDTLARLGGDEFGLLMEHCSIEEATRVAENLRKAVEEFRFVWEKKNFSLGVSIGLVPIISGKSNVKGVLGAADAACYAAKDAGRNRIHIYNPEDVELAQRRGEMKWVTRIKEAMDQNRLRLYVQPIVPLSRHAKNKKHYECLIRMLDENGKTIPPGAFLPAAERYDLSTRIDQWVFDSTYAWLEKRPGKSKGLTSCSVNLSGHSLSSDDFLNHIVEKLDKGTVIPSTICFEITETVAISKLSNAIKFMDVLKQKGCTFALDDFGSGVSSFGYLKNLPVDYLKIDGMFVREMVDDPIDLEMVRSINEIGHVMGKKTIAEFVENKEILASLKKLGVDYAQGYYVGKPRAIKVPVLKATDTKAVKKKAKKKARKVRTRKTDD